MPHGQFCANRETFGISINYGLLRKIGSKNCTLNGLSKQDVFSQNIRVLIGISWLMLILVGAFSNILVLFVIGYPKKMRTIANWLLFNLALADSLMTVIALPILGIFQTFYYPIWRFPSWTCNILNCFTHIGALASGASLAAISMHRFIVIRFPKKFLLTSKHLYITIALIWIIAIAGSTSSITSAGILTMVRPISGQLHLTKLCVQVNPSESKEDFQLAFRLAMYILFSLFLFVLYTNIGCFLYRSKSPGNQDSAGRSDVRKRQAVKMLAVATSAMIITYFPYMVLVGMTLFAKPGYFSPVFGIEVLCNICSSANHVCNPFIYCAFSSQFREGFKIIFKKILGKKVEERLASIRQGLSSRKPVNNPNKIIINVSKSPTEAQNIELMAPNGRLALRGKTASQLTFESIMVNDSQSDSASQLSFSVV